jgi:zinc protease
MDWLMRRAVSLFCVMVWILIPVAGQSGRGRQPVAVPPTTRPVPRNPVGGPIVLGIPDGGKLARQQAAGGVVRYSLRNELTVLVRERHSVPLVALEIATRAGWSSDPAGVSGVARLTLEMIRWGSVGRNGLTLDREVARLGGRITTRLEAKQSSLTIVAPAESCTAMIELLAGMVKEPELTVENLERTARLVDLSEQETGGDAERVAFDRLLGRAESLPMVGRVTLEQVRDFYARHYRAGNMVVVVTGDIFSLPILGQVQLRFGAMAGGVKAGAASAPARVTGAGAGMVAGETAAEGLRYSNWRVATDQSLVTVGYRLSQMVPEMVPEMAVTESLRERAVIEVLGAVMGIGRGSRLVQGIREGLASRDKASVGTAASVEYLPEAGGGWLISRLVVDPGRIDRAEAEYFREIERLRREVVSTGELQRAITMLEKRHYDKLATLEGEATLLARHQLIDGDFRLLESSLSRQRKVTATEVQQAAAKYLVLNRTVVTEVEPRDAPARTFTAEKFGELIVTFAPGAASPVRTEEIKPAPQLKIFAQGAERVLPVDEQNVVVAPIPLPIRDFSVLRGPRAFVREDKSRPIVSVMIVFQGGRLQENAATSGTTELMLRAMLKSTTNRKADLIAYELESYGADVEVVNEPDFYGFNIEVLSRNTEPAVKLLLEVIESPYFDREEVGRERSVLLGDQRRALDRPQSETRQLFLESILPGHPYALPRYGRAEVVGALTPEQVEEWHAKTIRRQYPFVFLVGDTDGSSMVSRIFSDGLKRGDLDKSLKVNLPTQFPPAQDRTGRSGRGVTLQTVGFRVGNQALTTPIDHLVASMIEELIACGPLLGQFREEQTLGAGVRARLERQIAVSFFTAEAATLPGKETAALDLISREFQRLATSTPTDEEFEMARNAAIGRYAIDLQPHPDRALEYARTAIAGGRPADVEAQPESMISIRKSDLKRVAESLFKNSQSGRGVLRGESPDGPSARP